MRAHLERILRSELALVGFRNLGNTLSDLTDSEIVQVVELLLVRERYESERAELGQRAKH